MNRKYCEKVQVSAMAILDGEVPQLSKEEISEHLKSCADCRYELEQQKEAIGLLAEQSRRSSTEDIWPKVAAAVEKSTASRKTNVELYVLGLLGLVLFVCKIVEVLPGLTPGVVIKLMPLTAVFIFFALLRQNPFSLSQHLRTQGDIR
ncbi:MAG: zf-HC2 domain-containing protein [Sedimentisphaerales bacterium]|nr:zf-HC2 domain-containing protein [Sedimentisphaerales bacterium]